MDWPTIVRIARKRVQEKQSSFGHRLGVDQATVSRWESGKQIPAEAFRDQILHMLETVEPAAAPDTETAHLSLASAAFSAAPTGIFLLGLDFRLVAVNTYMSTITGWPVESHIGRSLSEVHVDLGSQLEPMLPRILDGGLTVKHVRIGSPPNDQAQLWTCGLQSVRHQDGALIGICGALTAIPDETAASRAAPDTWLHSFFAQSPFGVIVFRPQIQADGAVADFQFVFTNAAALQALDRDGQDLSQETLLRLAPPPPGDSELFERCVDVFKSGCARDIVLSHKSENRCCWIHYTAMPLGRDVIVFMSDLTALYWSLGFEEDSPPEGISILSEKNPALPLDFAPAEEAPRNRRDRLAPWSI